MQIVSLGDNLHEISKLIFLKKLSSFFWSAKAYLLGKVWKKKKKYQFVGG